MVWLDVNNGECLVEIRDLIGIVLLRGVFWIGCVFMGLEEVKLKNGEDCCWLGLMLMFNELFWRNVGLVFFLRWFGECLISFGGWDGKFGE